MIRRYQLRVMANQRSPGSKRRRTAGWRANAVVLVIIAALAGAVAVEADQLAPDGPQHPTGTVLSALAAPSGTPAPGTYATGKLPAPTVLATVAPLGGMPIPQSYLGISIETWDLLRFDTRPAVFRRVLDLLSVRGDGPLVLRLGGNSADRTWWRTVPGRADRLPFRLTSRWFSALRALTLADHLRLLLDLNLVARDPAMASAFAREARAALPAGSIEAFEVGNEPDLYGRRWFEQQATFTDARPWRSGPWRSYAANLYAVAFRQYASALRSTIAPVGLVRAASSSTVAGSRRAVAPTAAAARSRAPIGLAGPELADPMRDLGFIRRLLATDRGEVRLLTGHSYRYSECSVPSQTIWPTIHRLLSAAATTGVAAGVEPAVRLAARAGLPFRLTELNSVSCGGRPGVSNTFATALWAPDALFALMRAGVAGANIHVRENKLNQAFAITARGLRPRPLLYGLLTFVRTLDGARELLRVHVRQPRRENVRVWAVRTASGGLHVLALDKGPHSVWLAVRTPAAGPATVLRLRASGVRARRGVTLGGQRLDAAGQWIGRPVTERLSPGRDGYELHLHAHSAAVLIAPGVHG